MSRAIRRIAGGGVLRYGVVAGVLENRRASAHDVDCEGQAVATTDRDIEIRGPGRESAGNLKVDLCWAGINQRRLDRILRRLDRVDGRAPEAQRQREAAGLRGVACQMRAENRR